jgi:hypothetical protein
MHEQKGILIAAAIAALVVGSGAFAQKDAAEKAKEGGIDHWIEYYKAERGKPAAASLPQRAVRPGDAVAPAGRAESDGSSKGKAGQN